MTWVIFLFLSALFHVKFFTGKAAYEYGFIVFIVCSKVKKRVRGLNKKNSALMGTVFQKIGMKAYCLETL